MDSGPDGIFDLKLQIQQLQDKVKFLAGGTDAEQLTEVLMEKEEECRYKDKTILDLQRHTQSLKERLDKTETERRAIKEYAENQAGLRRSLEARASSLESDKSRLQIDLCFAKEKHGTLEGEKASLQKLLSECRAKLEETTRLHDRSEAHNQELEEIARSHEKTIEELVLRKKDIASRARAMKANLEQLLADEKTRCGALDGQLKACKSEMADLKAQLHEKTKYISENSTRETALSQRTGELQVKLAALGEENSRLQETIMAMNNEKKDLNMLNVESKSRAAKYEEEIMSLKREMDRMRAGKDNEILAMSKQSQAREMLWKDKFKRREEESRVRAQELMEMGLMMREEADTVQFELKEQLRGRDELVGELKAEVNRLAEQVLDLEHQKKEMEDYKQSELLVERHWRASVQQEMGDLRKELAEQRKHASDVARLKQENEALKEKISRQEAYLRRKMLKDKQLKMAPGSIGGVAPPPPPAAAFIETADIPPEPPASRPPLDANHLHRPPLDGNHLHHHQPPHPPITAHPAADIPLGSTNFTSFLSSYKTGGGDKENCRQQTPTFVRRQISGTPTSELGASQPKHACTSGSTPLGLMSKASPFMNKMRDSPAARSRTPTAPMSRGVGGTAARASNATKTTTPRVRSFHAPPRSSTPQTARSSWK